MKFCFIEYKWISVHQITLSWINLIVYLKEKSYLNSGSNYACIIFWKSLASINQINQLNDHLRQTEKEI